MAAEIITKEDLQLFKVKLLAGIKQLLEKEDRSSSEWLKSSQVRKMLHLSANTLQALRISGKLNFTKVGVSFTISRKTSVSHWRVSDGAWNQTNNQLFPADTDR